MKRLLWVALIVVVVVWVTGVFDGEPRKTEESSEHRVEKTKPVNVTHALAQCVDRSARQGEYSSYDGGKSAVHLLEDACGDELVAWIDDCKTHPPVNDEESCLRIAAIAAQASLKTYNK